MSDLSDDGDSRRQAGSSIESTIMDREQNININPKKPLTPSSPNQMLSRQAIDEEYGVGDGRLRRWLELAALRGDGPPMVKLSGRMVRYRRSDFERWLDARTVLSTSEIPMGTEV